MRLSISYEYIHAERLAEQISGNINVNVQLTFPSTLDIQFSGTELKVRFMANITTTPPALNITLRGILLIAGEHDKLSRLEENLKKKKPDPHIIHFLTSHVLFESALLARELGLPPTMPLPQPHRGRRDTGAFKPV